MTTSVADPAFVGDPVATHSGQFPLARPGSRQGSTEAPSAPGVRPWVLRDLETPSLEGLPDTAGWVYDRFRQVTVDRDGVPVVSGPPTAKSRSQNDGDEGPNENDDWSYDFCPDEPFGV